jgi:hypothetical protein
LEEVCSTRSVPRYYKTENRSKLSITRVEVGSNTSNVTLRIVEGNEKGSLKSETVKYGHDSEGTWIRERLR